MMLRIKEKDGMFMLYIAGANGDTIKIVSWLDTYKEAEELKNAIDKCYE